MMQDVLTRKSLSTAEYKDLVCALLNIKCMNVKMKGDRREAVQVHE